MKIWLKPDGPDEVRVVSGGFERTFIRSEEPFEVSEHDWDRVLKPTSYLVASPPVASDPRSAAPGGGAGPPGGGKEAKKPRASSKQAATPPRAAPGGPSKAKEG